MNARIIAISGVIASLVIGYGYGLLSYKYNLFPVPIVRFVKEYAQDDGVDTIGFRDTSNRIELDCHRLPQPTAIILTIGQSNAANHGETLYSPQNDFYNFNFFDGKCYRAMDPLLGATGNGGSVWSRLGSLLIERKVFSNVIIAPIAVNSSSILRWKPGGDLYKRIHAALNGLMSLGLNPTHILWHQGEADAMHNMDGKTYASALEELIAGLRSKSIDSPIFIAVTSMCHNPGSDDIRNAQINTVDRLDNVFLGANTDLLESMSLRYDGCHFSDEGLWQHATLWLDALTQPK